MTTYTIVQYDVARDVMYFLGAPTPGLKTLIENNSLSDTSTKQIIEGDSSTQNGLVPASASAFLLNFFENDVPEIDLNNAVTVTSKIEIIDDTEAGDVYVICKNQDKTTTYVTKSGSAWDVAYVELLKPGKKWPTLGKCDNCLKFTFSSSNDYNFTGNLGGAWDGTFKNGQKVYEFYLPDYSSPVGFGATELYKIYWKPGITYSGTTYSGTPFTITNQNKWVATPATLIDVINEKTFFHVLNNLAAPCPSALAPSWYNFFGEKGFFLLNSVPQTTPLKPCPEFSPTPGTVNWGYNCGSSGCVSAPSGSIGEFATLAACWVSCSLPPPPVSSSNGYNCIDGNCVESQISGTFQYATLIQCEASCSAPSPVTSSWYACTQNGCVQVPSGSAGAFVTQAECDAVCNPPLGGLPTTCSCDPDLSPVINPSFFLGSTGWTFTPDPFLSGVGGWDFSQGYAQANTQSPFSTNGTSSVSLTQANLFTLSCSYEVCFQAWNLIDNNVTSVTVDTGNYLTNPPLGTGPLTTTPTAYTFTLNNVETTDLTFFVGTGAPPARVAIDNICVTLIGCPPPTPPSEGTGSVIPPEDCYITGSISSYVSASYDCLCPEGFTSDGSGSCISSGPAIISASAGLYTPSTATPNMLPFYLNPSGTAFINGTGSISNGYSINQIQPSFIPSYYEPIFGKNFGMAQPVLYHSWSFNGAGYSSINNPTPFSGSNKVYNTQYTFDILSSSFWYQPELGDNMTSRWVAQLGRDIVTGIPQSFPAGTFGIGDRWVGFGATINVPTNKTYYVGIIGTGALKIKLDGTTIMCTSPTQTSAPSYIYSSIFNYPAYTQNAYARIASGSGWWGATTLGYSNVGVLPSPFNSFNPYISDQIYSAFVNYYFQSTTSEYAFLTPYGANPGYSQFLSTPAAGTTMNFGGKFYSSNNLYIYPVTMSAGCHKINFEANPDYFKYCTTANGGLGGIILDMTAQQIVSASSYNDLNILWDSTYLDPITSSLNNTQNYYIYSYPVDTIPLSSSYVSWCPTGSTAVGGNPCNGCATSGSSITTIPCGNCLECTHGLLYNGYAVDKGGATLQGRGPGGIVNTAGANASTWVIPTESDWNGLVTFLNGGTAPVDVTITGSLGTISGGKLKDYTRDLEATCWENPNIGAQTDVSSSGWAGTAGGRRKDDGTFEGLGFEGLWWSANSLTTPPVQNGSLMAARRLEHYSADVFRDIFSKSYGCSIRLVRPATTGETNGMFIPDAYVGKNGTLYDGIVINNQVWITKNLSETLYNDNTSITTTTSNTVWSATVPTATDTACYYNNDVTNANILNGNINSVTQECYTFPTYYVYEKCDGSEFLVQPVSGSTTIVGKVLKDSNYDCWSFFGTSTGIPTYPHTYSATNYFSGSNYVYDNCNQCEAIHTIYMKFGTKNC
jgi:hypothetical protein